MKIVYNLIACLFKIRDKLAQPRKTITKSSNSIHASDTFLRLSDGFTRRKIQITAIGGV